MKEWINGNLKEKRNERGKKPNNSGGSNEGNLSIT